MLRVLLIVGVIVALAPGALAQSTSALIVEVPETIVGDGKGSTTLRVRSAKGVALSGVSLRASAGTVSAPRQEGAAWIFDYRVPRIAVDLPVALVVQAKAGRRSVRASETLNVTAPPRSTRMRRSSGALEIEFPDRVIRGTSAKIRLRKTAEDAPLVYASSGTLAPLSLDGEHWVTSFEPGLRHPHFVLIAAVSADGETVDSAMLPVQVTPSLEVNTEPNAAVSLEIGTEVLGPFASDARGRVRVDVLIPPGTDDLLISGVDRAGNSHSSVLPVSVPKYNLLVLACSSWGKQNYVVTGGPDGKPLSIEGLVVDAGSATLSSPKELAPGTYEVALTEFSNGVEELSIEAKAGSGQQNRCSRPSPAQLPSDVRITLARDVHTPASGPIRITLKSIFSGSGERRDVLPTLSATRGTLSEVERTEIGGYQADWSLPDAHEGQTEANVDVVIGPVKQTSTLSLRPGPVARLMPEEPPRGLTADGGSSATIAVTAQDAHGNPVTGLTLDAASAGTVEGFRETAPGRYQARYVAPLRRNRVRERVVVSSGATQTQIDFTLLATDKPRSVGLRAGGFTNVGSLQGGALSVDVMQSLPVLRRRLAVGLQTGLLYAADDVEAIMAGPEGLPIRVRSIPALAKLRFSIPAGPIIATGSLGAGLLWSTAWRSSELGGTPVQSDVQPAGLVALGGEYPLGPGRLTLDLSYMLANIDDGEVIVGNPVGVIAGLGYRLGF